MKNSYLIYCGDYFSITGGYIYNRKVVENLKLLNIVIEPVQLSDKQSPFRNKPVETAEEKIIKIPSNSVLLIDSLAFGSNHYLWKKFSHSHMLVPIVHLPLFLNPDFSTDSLIKEKELEAFGYAEHIIVTSEFTKSLLVKEGIAKHKITVILPGVEPAAKKQQYPKFPQQLLCVSNITANKNQLLLLKVLSLVKKFSWKMHFVGTFNANSCYYAEIMEFTLLNKLEDRIIMHGQLTGDTLQRLYSHSDIFLFAGKFETYGMVVAEALNSGLPVLAYKSLGIKQSFDKFPVVYFETEDGLRELLVRLFKEADFYSELTTKMIENRTQFSSWNAVANEFAELLHQIRRNRS